MEQEKLFHGEHLPSRLRYQTLFSHLPRFPPHSGRGRPRTDPNALLRALIYRCLRRLPTLSDLAYTLAENPSLVEAVGLDPFGPLPPVERFSAWLRSTDNHGLQQIRAQLVGELLQQQTLSGTTLVLDSAPIPAAVRENNLKTSVRDRFNKHRFPPTDPQARLGAYRAYVPESPHRVHYFWGYRNHIVVDFDTELPLAEQTHPANFAETRCAIPLLQASATRFALPVRFVCADSGYDSEPILAFIFEQLHAQPVVAPHPRRGPNPDFRIRGKVVLCPANLPMVSKGRMTPKRTGITYPQYCCPLHYRKKSLQHLLFCPAQHPKFFSQKGCNYLRRLTPSVREQIPYGSAEFVALYKKRTSIERVFSRLLCITMQKPTVHGLQAIQNHCTIAHITVLLVATVAAHQGHSDKLAFVRSFVPNFLRDS